MAAKKSGKKSEIQVSVKEVVDYLRIEGDFAPGLAKVVERKMAAQAARDAGIRVTARELQRAADGFRALRDLNKASVTAKWMKANGIEVEALEDYLETNILLAKFKDKLAKAAPKNLVNSKAVKELVRALAYQEWLATAMR